MLFTRPFFTIPVAFLITVLAAPLPTFAAEQELAPSGEVSDLGAKVDAGPPQVLTPKILYQFLLAEIALGRGQSSVSAAAYTDLAKTTRDPRIARRAAEVAYYARQPQLSLEAARLWAETDPGSIQAKQAYWALLANSGKADQLAAELSQVVAAEPDKRGAMLMQLGRLLSRFEDKKAMAQVAEQVTAPYLDLPEAHFVRAQAAYSLQDGVRAGRELDQALVLKPDWEPAAILKAQLLIANPQVSIDSLAAFVKKYPKARDARLAYARALIEGKRYDQARGEFSTLLADEPDRPDLLYSLGLLSLQSNDVASAEKYLKAVLDKDFAEMDSVHFYLGQIAEEAGRTKEAMDHYDAIVPGSQHHIQGQLRVVSILAKNGQVPAALERLQAAQAASPRERVNLLVMEAQLLSDTGRTDAAYQILADALQGSPDDTTLLYESALFAERLGKSDILERNLRKAIRLKPDYAHAYNALGYSLADRNLSLDEANSLIDKALLLIPEDAAILDSKGWVSYRRGDLQAAADILHKALTLRPDPEIAAHLGEVLWRMGREGEATKTWDAALKLAPDNEVLTATIKRFRN